MNNIFYLRKKELPLITTVNLSFIALIILFFTETSYYLLILQTGIVEYYHSNLAQIWMIPVDGVLGILTIAILKYRQHIVSMALLRNTNKIKTNQRGKAR